MTRGVLKRSSMAGAQTGSVDSSRAGRHADAVVLAARANQTSRESLRDAYERFDADGISVLETYKHHYGGAEK